MDLLKEDEILRMAARDGHIKLVEHLLINDDDLQEETCDKQKLKKEKYLKKKKLTKSQMKGFKQ